MFVIEVRLLLVPVEYLFIELKQINLSNLQVERSLLIPSRTLVKKYFLKLVFVFKGKAPIVFRGKVTNTCYLNYFLCLLRKCNSGK